MNRIVDFALRQRLLIVGLFFAMIVAGVIGFINLNIEAYPDPVPPMVEVITQTQGLSAEEMERNVTIPIEVQMAGIPHLTAIRAISLFGLSDIKIQFTYDYTNEQARQQVINRLSQLPPLAGGAQPTLSPTSPVGEIYRYRIAAPKGYSVMDLKTLQDWVLQRRFKRIPGVIDVTGWGGKLRAYDVVIDQNRLNAHGVTVAQVLAALSKSDGNVGGQTINFGEQAAIVRGIGLIQSPDAIQNVLVGQAGGAPVLIKDVATVKVGNAPRMGIAGYNNDDDIVQGIVLMQRGAQSMPTIKAVQAEVANINDSGVLPPGVHLERIYDRSDLINLTIHTVMENMVVGILLIFALQWLFLGNLRSAIIVAATIPFALAFAILILVLQGESANLLSVGALDFGLVVDACVIMVENIFRHMVERSAAVENGQGRYTLASRFGAVLGASSEVSRGIFFAAAIIIASFLPLFTLTGVEGHIFGPMAKTYAYAISGGLLATFTVAPVLSTLLLPDKLAETETFIVGKLRAVYEPAASFALRNKVVTLGGAALMMVWRSSACARWASSSCRTSKKETCTSAPPSLLDQPGGGREGDQRGAQDHRVLSGDHGGPVRPWPPGRRHRRDRLLQRRVLRAAEAVRHLAVGMTKEKLIDELSTRLAKKYPGVDFSFSQIIEDNVEEAASGVKGANSIKLFGPDLVTLEKLANQIKAQMAKVKGIEDLGVFEILGQPTVRIDVDRAKAAVTA